ncbi:hypothetical protein D3C81_2063140 [compost metagenome]
MHELRKNSAAGFMNLSDDFSPAVQSSFSKDARQSRLTAGRRMVNNHTFRNDETYLILRTAAVIRGDVLSRHTPR